MDAIEINYLHDSNTFADTLWQRPDLMLVAAGSGPCIRELYFRAKLHHKLPQLYICHTNAQDYMMGTAEDKLFQAVYRAAATKGVQIVVIYLNCLDILTRVDFTYLENTLTKKTGVLIKCFFRGPLGKEDIHNFVPIDKFMQQLPPERGHIISGIKQLPPLMTDISGAIDCLPTEDLKLLIASPGCCSCLRDGDLRASVNNLYHLDSSSRDFIFGLEENCLNQCKQQLNKKKYQGINFISSAVPSFIGFDGDWVKEEMGNKNLHIRNFPLDGFNDAMYGASCVQKILAHEAAVNYRKKSNEILILGYSPLLCGDKEQYTIFLSYIQKLGYVPRFLGDPCQGQPALSWVVSTAGLTAGQYLYEQFDIPLLVSCPVGNHAAQIWRKHFRELCMAQTAEKRELCIHKNNLRELDARKLLFIGDPVHIMGIAHALWHTGFQHIRLATICLSKGSKKLYRQTPGADKWLIIVDSIDTLIDLWEDADIIFADEQLSSLMQKAGVTQKRLIPLPWGLISGRSTETSKNGVLGNTLAESLIQLTKENFDL